MTQYRWLCQPMQPNVPTAPPAPAHPSYIIDSTLPPVSGDEFATLQREAADLRRRLERMQDTIAARTSDADALRCVLAACREALGVADNAALYAACAEAADLRRELDKLRHEHAAVLTRDERGIGKSAG